MNRLTLILIIILVATLIFSTELNTIVGIFLEFQGMASKEVISRAKIEEAFIKSDQKQVIPLSQIEFFSIPVDSDIDIIYIDQNFNKDSEYILDYPNTISSLSINGDVNLNSDTSYVRIILKDQSNKEYIITELNSLFTNEKNSFSNFCEETCNLNSINVKSILIELSDASVHINSLNSLPISLIKTTKPLRSEKDLKTNREKIKIERLKQRIDEKDLKWVAGETSISKLSYEEKKKMFGGKVPNLQGFEYYEGGVFTIPSQSENSITGKIISIITGMITNKITSKAVAEQTPPTFDWRNVHGENWLTPVKNQGQCGSCWVFGTVGALEAVLNLYYNKHIDKDLSEQQIITCSTKDGCDGGYPAGALEYIDRVGLLSEELIPNRYSSLSDGTIPYPNTNPYSNSTVVDCAGASRTTHEKIRIYSYIPYLSYSEYGITHITDDSTIKQALIQYGPLIFGIVSWNHVGAVVGYYNLDSSGETVWIFKNSWGTDWGESGYAYLKFDPIDRMGVYAIRAPFTTALGGYKIECVDKDNDEYCNWGIYRNKPSTCPAFCKPEKDLDDSTASITAIACTDSDISSGEGQYYIEGSINFYLNSSAVLQEYDICEAGWSRTLVERVCIDPLDPAKNFVRYNCSDGCHNNACILVCSDTDRGKNYNVKGTVTAKAYRGLDFGTIIDGQLTKFEDYCCTNCYKGPSATGSNLVERWCENGIAQITQYTCPYGCSDGACIQQSVQNVTCIDSDGGENYYVKGTAYSEIFGGKYDCCKTSIDAGSCSDSGSYLSEAFCDASNKPASRAYLCPNGCNDGVCIQTQNITHISCSETDSGINYNQQGKVCLEGECETDYCLDNINLREFYLEEEGILGGGYCSLLTDIFSQDYNCPNGCSNGACVSSGVVEEYVKCVFNNAIKVEICKSVKGECSAVGVCTVAVSGKAGEKVIWESTCGGYADTIIDGENDYAIFTCECTTDADCPINNKCGAVAKTCFDLNNLEPNQDFLYVTEGIVLGGKKVTLNNVGSDGSVMIDVDDTIAVIPYQTTRIVNEIKIKNIEIFYKETKSERSAILEITLVT